MYGTNNYVKVFDDEITNWLIYEAGFNHSKCQMYVYYKYATDVSKLVVLSYVYDCLYWYTYQELENWFVDKLGNRLLMNFLVYAHWFMPIIISQLNDHYISVNQARYPTSVVANYLDTDTIKKISVS